MLTFYNWRLKRSGAGLRIIGDAVIGDKPTDKLSSYIRSHKISDIYEVAFNAQGEIVAYGRDGKTTYMLSTRKISLSDLV